MKTIKVSELTGATLDWAVAKCEGRIYGARGTRYEFQPSTHWSQGGPIIEREKLSVGTRYTNDQIHHDADFLCWARNAIGGVLKYGPTPLIAAMRCYVASKLGDTVKIPEELF